MEQARLDQQGFREIAGEATAQRLTVIGGPAQPETTDRLRVEAAALEIVARPAAGGRPQPRFVEGGGGFERLEQGLLPLRLLALLRRRLRHRQPDLARQLLDRLQKVEVVGAHRKADRVAMRTAAETVKEGFVLDHVEGRGLLVVERAEPGQLAPAPRQPDAAADERRQRDPAAQLVEKARRKGHRSAARA